MFDLWNASYRFPPHPPDGPWRDITWREAAGKNWCNGAMV